MTTTLTLRPALEVADILRRHGTAFLDKHGAWLSATQRQALRDLAVCRTAALGGHVEHCLDCGHQRIAYHSCRNRHCPKCQALARAQWLDRQAEHLLPVEYHHVVFTLPAELSDLALANAAVVYDLLLRSSAATLRDVAANPKRLGALPGMLLVLHTWGQNLHHHPHVHCVVTGGGLSCDASGQVDAVPCWRACRPGFFLPVRVLSRVFRGQFLASLRQAFAEGQLLFPGRLAHLSSASAFVAWLRPLYGKDWVVYAKPPFGGPAQVLKYLARYTHGVAISNVRLVAMTGEDDSEGTVTFRYKDYADSHRCKTMTLTAQEFLRRFVQHVLPRGFVKIRHYGLLANRCREQLLSVCRRLLLATVAAQAAAASSDDAVIEPAPLACCAKCGGSRLAYRELTPEEALSGEGLPDSS